MTMAMTLSRYIARQFVIAALGMLVALTLLVSLFDFIDLLRRASNHPDAGFMLVIGIAALRLPYLAMQVLPFAVQLGAMLCFWRLTRSSELIVARAAGVSAWEFLAGPVLCAALFGAVTTAAVTPLSSALFARAEALENRTLTTGGGPIELNGGQLWLRQADRALGPGGVAILHGHDVSVHGQVLTAQDVTVFRLLADDQLSSRIQAASARLADGSWTLAGARVMRPDQPPTSPTVMHLPTDLTMARVQESFASPDTLSVWQLPGFIALLERSGFSSIRHRLHFQALLALPLLTATMALVGAGFSLRPARRGGVARMLAAGVGAGFALFMISKLAEEFGDSGALPVGLAAWAPAAAGLMLALALLLHMEDG